MVTGAIVNVDGINAFRAQYHGAHLEWYIYSGFINQ